MKEWCLKNPGYAVLALYFIVYGVTEITAVLKGTELKPLIYIGLDK